MMPSSLLAPVLTLMFASMLLKPSLAGSNWGQEERDFITDLHNDLRRGEGGCHMNKLVYDMELEKQAKQWAEGCVFKHELKGDRGENLAWDSNEAPEKDLIKGSVGRWFDEKKTYSYGQYSCGNSGSCHYSQLVWGKTSKIGCYSTRCANLVNAYQNAWYLVCFYTPKGNWNGEKPYEKNCKSMCQEGQTEDNGLCVGEATGGTSRVDLDEVCDDDQGRCKMWARNGQCDANPDYMKEHCRKSCNLCQGGDCLDQHANCEAWAKIGECTNNKSYMEGRCKKSCNLC